METNMKKNLSIIGICLLMLCCNSKTVEKPKNLISEDVMVDILYDLHVFNAIKLNAISNANQDNRSPAAYIYQKYEVDSAQFASSDRYYAADIEEYEKLYQRVTTKITDENAKIDSFLVKNPETRVEKIPVPNPTVVDDSIVKNRPVGNSLFKKSTENQ